MHDEKVAIVGVANRIQMRNPEVLQERRHPEHRKPVTESFKNRCRGSHPLI
jgi:hypothetical protein